MASLTWKVKKIEDSCGNSNPSWISVSPSTGTSSVNPNITVSEATSPDDCSDGYVVLSASTGDETIIPVSRCLPDCNCIKAAFASTIDGTEYGENYEGTVTAGTYNTSACGTIGVIVGGTIFDRSSVSVSNGKITIKVTANTSYDKRYDFFRFTLNGKTCFSGNISQAAKVNPCYTSTTVSVTPTTITDETCAGTSATYSLTGTGNECWFVKKAKITPNDLAIINLDSSEITVTPNPSYEPRNGTCVLTMQNGTNGIEVQNTINITQAACEAPATCDNVSFTGDTNCAICDCNENDFQLIYDSISIPSSGYSDYPIAKVNDCIGDIVWNESTGWDCSITGTDELLITVPNNGGATRQEIISFIYPDRCGKELGRKQLELIQEGTTCNCDSFIAPALIIPSSGGEYTAATVAEGCTILMDHTNSDTGAQAIIEDFAYDSTPGNQMIRITANTNSSSSSRSGTVTVYYSVNGVNCESTINLTQTAPVSVITYYSPSKLNVNLNDFTPTATAETFSNGVGKIEFAADATEIKEKAFSGKTTMTGIDMPNTITSIGHSAFTDCTSLTSITIPSNVHYINNHLLYNCTSLTSVTLESETLQLKPYCISDCPSLRKIEMTSVIAYPLENQNALENTAECPIYVPEEHLNDFWNSSTFQYKDRVISHVGNNCFVYFADAKLNGGNIGNAYSGQEKAGKLSITTHEWNPTTRIGKITYSGPVGSFHSGTFDTQGMIFMILPESLKRIGQEVFVSCYYLKSVFIPDSVRWIGSSDGGCETFHNCTGLKRFVAGSGLTSIGTSCFTIGSGLSLTGFTFYSTTAPTLEHQNTFENTGNTPIYVPCGRVNSYKTANIWNDPDIKNRIKAIPPCTS